MEKVYKNIIQEIDKEITQLSNDNNFSHSEFWLSINNDIRRKYKVWKNGNEELELSNHDFYCILAKKDNFIEEEFRKLYEDQSVAISSICQKYKTTVQTVARAAKYLNLAKRTSRISLKVTRAREAFVSGGYLEDLMKGVRDIDLMKKYNLTKFKHKQMKQFCLLHKI